MPESESAPVNRSGLIERPVTIRDVAERAGVSKSLVSLVLRGSTQVSDARREAVLKAISELNYRPNRTARALTTARTDTVGVLLNNLSNPWFVDLLDGLSAALHASGLAPVLAATDIDRRVGRSSVAALLSQRVDGLIVVGTTDEKDAIAAAAKEVSIVLAGTREPRVPHMDIAVNDDEGGGRLATEHLIGLGHRRIAHLQGPGDVGDLRLAGYRTAMLAADLDPGEYLETGGMSEESGYAATRRLLARADRPTAIFAFNDIAAIGAMSAAADGGLSIPRDLSLVGYDNTYLARIRHISLTCVDNGSFAVGVQAGRFLIERLDAPGLSGRLYSAPTQLHVRGTSGPVPG